MAYTSAVNHQPILLGGYKLKMASNATGCVTVSVLSGTIEVTNTAWTVGAAILGVAIGIIFGVIISYALYRAFNQPQVIYDPVISHQCFRYKIKKIQIPHHALIHSLNVGYKIIHDQRVYYVLSTSIPFLKSISLILLVDNA